MADLRGFQSFLCELAKLPDPSGDSFGRQLLDLERSREEEGSERQPGLGAWKGTLADMGLSLSLASEVDARNGNGCVPHPRLFSVLSLLVRFASWVGSQGA